MGRKSRCLTPRVRLVQIVVSDPAELLREAFLRHVSVLIVALGDRMGVGGCPPKAPRALRLPRQPCSARSTSYRGRAHAFVPVPCAARDASPTPPRHLGSCR